MNAHLHSGKSLSAGQETWRRHWRAACHGSFLWRQSRCLMMFGVVVFFFTLGPAYAAEPASGSEEHKATESGESQVQERAVPRPPAPGNTRPDVVTDPRIFERKPPPDLCIDGRCRCDTYADCQVLAPICGSSCPAGSHHCSCTPTKTVH